MPVTKLGVVGLGGLGEALIRDVPKFAADLEVVAVQDILCDVARDVGERYKVRWAGQSFDDLLAVGGVDAVVLCTPNALHAPQAQAALRADKDVLVQKPLALSHADAQTTIDLAASLGRLLFVDYTYRFLATMARFRSAAAHLGRVRTVHASFHNIYGPGAEKAWFFDPRSSGGGALTDLGVHLVDLAIWLLQPREVELSTAELLGGGPVESAAHVGIRMDDVDVQLDVSWSAPRPTTEIAFELAADSGARLRWENVDGSFFRFRTVLDGEVLIDRETTLREDTLRAFADSLTARRAPAIDVRVYTLLDRAYGRSSPFV